MRNNERMIQRMSLEEKVRFLLSDKLYSNGQVEGYKFPIFNLKDEQEEIESNAITTIFPKQVALASTWNNELIEKISEFSYEEKFNIANEVIFRKEFIASPSFSEDQYFISQYALDLINGVKKTSALLVVDQPKYETNKFEKEFTMIPYETLINSQKIDYVLVHSIHELKYYIEDKKFQKTIIGNSSNADEIARMLFSGASLIYVDESYEENVKLIIEKNKEYFNALAQYHNHQIDANEFDKLNRRGVIISDDVIDNAVDKLLDLISKIDYLRNEDASLEFVNGQAKKKFDYKEHASYAYQGASESIIMLKNENEILPLNHLKKVAFIGDAIEDDSYFLDYFKNKPSSYISTFKLLDSYVEFNVVGYAHGYLKNNSSMELVGAARNLAEKADIAVVYLWGDGKKKLPEEQLKIIDELSDIQCNIVAVIISPCQVDISFAKKCKAVLYTNGICQETPRAILDILCGKVSPSGRLSSTYPLSLTASTENENEYPKYINRKESVAYPFGFGLSYTKFEYSNIEVNIKGVELTVKNVGEYDSYEVVELYVSNKENTNPINNSVLRGFKKVFVRKDEAVKVFIPFDSATFRYFDETKHCYGVKGGKYNVLICTDSRTVKLTAEVKLNDYLENRPLVTGEMTLSQEFSENVVQDFINSTRPKPKPVNFIKNVIISSIIGVYFIVAAIIMILYAFGDANYFGTNPYISLFVGILIIVSALVICGLFDYSSYKKCKNQIPAETNETLTTLIDDVPEFKVTQRKVYDVVDIQEENDKFEKFVATPEDQTVENEETEIEEVEEEQEESKEIVVVDDSINEKASEVINNDNEILTEEEIEQLEKNNVKEEDLVDEQYDENESLDKDIVYDDSSSFTQLCESFIAFAQSKGLQVDYVTVREIFASLASTHIIVLKNTIKEDTDLFMNILNEFLENKGNIYHVNNDAKSFFDICFEKDEDKYNKTDFVENVFYSTRMKNNVNLVMLSNVNMKYVSFMLKDFVDYSNHPSKEHIVSFSKRLKMKLPNNMIIVINPTNNYYLDLISHEFAQASISINLSVRKVDQIENGYQKETTISYPYLNDLIREAKKTSYLSEEIWKKFDILDNELLTNEKIKLGNKLTLEIERYTSVYIDCEGEALDALSSTLDVIILPFLKSSTMNKNKDANEKIITLLERIFGEENLTRAKNSIQISPVAE